MAIDSVHPKYTERLDGWELGTDSYAGEPAVKAAASKYLPPTQGHILDGYPSPDTLGSKAYEAYLKRASYPEIYKEAVVAAVGILHGKPPTIELPKVMEPLLTNATLLGESLEMLLRRINVRQLVSGRIGILGDVKVKNGEARPVLVTYNELAVRNWDDSAEDDEDSDARFIVLDESNYVMDTADLSWTFVNKYRVLALVADDVIDSKGSYASGVFEQGEELATSRLEAPTILGGKSDTIPFAFINANDLSATPDNIPLLGLANLCMTIYRGEADYRHNLFMQGQDTLVRIGAGISDEDEPVRTGAGSRIDVPIGGDVKYAGVSGQGLSEQRQALENDYKRAVVKAGQLTDSTSRAKESGDALKIRVAAQAATLPQIAKTGAAGLEKVLKIMAKWFGANPDDVVVKPHLEFADPELNGTTLVDIMKAKGLDAPLSDESIHAWMKEQKFTTKTFEEEMLALSNEEPRI